MRNTISKALIAGLATLSLSAAVLAPVDSTQAAPRWHGGGHWHRGGGWRGGGWHGGGGWWGPAVVGGLAAGALAAPYVYGYGSSPYYGYVGSCYAYQPTYDGYGNYIGQQLVNVC